MPYASSLWATLFPFPPSGSMDEGVSEGLPSMQGTSNTGGHTEDDERYHDLLRLAYSRVIHSKKKKNTACWCQPYHQVFMAQMPCLNVIRCLTLLLSAYNFLRITAASSTVQTSSHSNLFIIQCLQIGTRIPNIVSRKNFVLQRSSV